MQCASYLVKQPELVHSYELYWTDMFELEPSVKVSSWRL